MFQNLDFIVSLIDQVSGPAGKIMTNVDRMTTNIQTGYQKIGYGAAGITGAAFALDRLIAPTRELDNALRTVESLDVVDSVLSDLTSTSLKFSTTYGGAAADFVSSSYDIQSAIGGLVGNELSQFTTASAILAKGTKADVSTITGYVGTMYGIFKNSANEMGKGQWVEMLAGQTAQAVQIFKTTGSGMASAFENTGASATSMGVPLSEQIALLGTLQATMSGSEAGTKYKAFLDGVGKAQAKLGLSFVDNQGQMLPIVDIMQKIQGKYGDLSTVADSDLLKSAFGSKEATDLIKLLSADVEGLNSNIGLIGQQTGMDKAMQMAKAMVDPFEVAGSQLQTIQTVLGKALMPTLLPWLSAMGEGAQTLLRWTELFPNLTRLIGVGTLTVFGLIAAISALSIAVGVGKFLMVGWGAATTLMNGLLIASKFSLLTLVPAVWSFTAALLANPITWIVAAVGLLGYGLYKLADHFNVFELIKTKFMQLKQFFDGFNLMESMIAGIEWLIDKINLIPGINIGGNTPEAPRPIAVPASLQAQRGSVRGGGLINRVSNATSNNSRNMGDVIVNNYGDAMSGQTLNDELAFAAG